MKSLMKSFVLFPEYKIYKIAQNQNQQNRDILLGLVILWIILKSGIILGIIVDFLTPYKLTSANLIGIFFAVAIVIVSTSICLRRVSET